VNPAAREVVRFLAEQLVAAELARVDREEAAAQNQPTEEEAEPKAE